MTGCVGAAPSRASLLTWSNCWPATRHNGPGPIQTLKRSISNRPKAWHLPIKERKGGLIRPHSTWYQTDRPKASQTSGPRRGRHSRGSPAFCPASPRPSPSMDGWDVGSDDGEECANFNFDTEEMYKFLETIKHLKVDPQCLRCKATAGKQMLKEPKSRFMMCSGCSQCFCAGSATNEDEPGGHARSHAKSACHHVALWIDQPNAAYCFKCGHSLNLEVIASEARAHELYVVRGIPNRGNTCFVNALMQCLFALGKLRMWMFGLAPDAPTGFLGVALKELFVETMAGNDARATLNPDKLLECLGALNTKYKDRTTQQDSHELLVSLLKGLIEEELLNRPPDMGKDVPTVVDSLFLGQLSQTLICKCCSKPSVQPESFSELALALPQNSGDSHIRGSSSKSVASPRSGRRERKDIKGLFQQIWDEDKHKIGSLPSVKECLEYYFREEIVTRNCESCTKDEKTSTSQSKDGGQMVASINESTSVDRDQTERDHHGKAEEKSNLFSAHDNQNASTRNQETRMQLENTAHQVGEAPDEQKGRHADKARFLSKLPPVLTLQILRCEGTNKRPGHMKFEENLDVGKYLEPSSKEKNNARYRLAGVIEHIETSSKGGHYVAYVRRSRTGSEQLQSSGSSTWFFANDTIIKNVSLARVLRCEAYLLFYQRIED